MTTSSHVTPITQRPQRTGLGSRRHKQLPAAAHKVPLSPSARLPLGVHLNTSTSVYAPEQMPLPIPMPRTLLPAPVEHGPVSSGELRHRSGRFMQAVAEVLSGMRPPRQLSPWMTREVYGELTSFVNRKFNRDSDAISQRAQVVSVHVFMVNEDAAEIAARMVVGGRSHAIAARLQHVRDPRERSVWRCTSLAWA